VQNATRRKKRAAIAVTGLPGVHMQCGERLHLNKSKNTGPPTIHRRSRAIARRHGMPL
jgi:hypothetical protein